MMHRNLLSSTLLRATVVSLIGLCGATRTLAQHRITAPESGAELVALDPQKCTGLPETELTWEVDSDLGQPRAWRVTASIEPPVDGQPSETTFHDSGELLASARSHLITSIETTGKPVHVTLWWHPVDAIGSPRRRNMRPAYCPPSRIQGLAEVLRMAMS